MVGVLGMILVGGEGLCLKLLIEICIKLVVFFGGSYCLIDFVFNNFVNVDLMWIYVLM